MSRLLLHKLRADLAKERARLLRIVGGPDIGPSVIHAIETAIAQMEREICVLTPTQETHMNNSEAYHWGCEAWDRGEDRNQNPYESRTWEHEQWNLGWDTAHAGMEE